MARAHSIDVRPFHQQNVLQHPFIGHHLARHGVHLMTVHAAHAHLHTVHKKHAILDFETAEAHVGLHILHNHARGIYQLHAQVI